MVQNLATGAGGTRRGRTPDEFVAHHEPAGAGKQGYVHFQNFSLQTSLFTYHIKLFTSCMEY